MPLSSGSKSALKAGRLKCGNPSSSSSSPFPVMKTPAALARVAGGGAAVALARIAGGGAAAVLARIAGGGAAAVLAWVAGGGATTVVARAAGGEAALARLAGGSGRPRINWTYNDRS
jgi:hypothetical protein